jgi:hypothetical protein
MNGKLSNISKWIFGALALITVVLGVIFYLDLHSDGRTNLILNWGYILIILGIVMIICSAIVAAIVKGVNWKASPHRYRCLRCYWTCSIPNGKGQLRR